MKKNKTLFLEDINRYYSKKIKQHGATPQGVDWNSKESQEIRFAQLCKLIGTDNWFTILDYGCGYGAMFPFLLERFKNFAYTGYDLSLEMIQTAQSLYGDSALWVQNIDQNNQYDYVIASGIFNVRLSHSDEEWSEYIKDTLNEMNKLSLKGMAFNMLTSYSDKEYMKEYLFYANPCFYFDYCKNYFSKNIALLHDYNLYEFTIIVRKT